MGIWYEAPTLEDLNAMRPGTILETLGIEFVEIGDDFLAASMPVDQRTIQPFGLLHGGASVVLAESLGSIGAHLCLDPTKQYCVGLDVNANHIRAKRSGTVVGLARPIHRGKSTHVWEINVSDEKQQLVSVSRLTLAILEIGG